MMTASSRPLAAALISTWGVLASASLPACQICYPFPLTSAADRLIAADCVVLARENPDKPFSLRAGEVLKGAPDDRNIDLFLDSSTRRWLKVNPENAVICVQRTVTDDTGWTRIGSTSDTFAPLVREILARAPRWQDDPGARPEFFAEYLGHDDQQARTTAHLEVARASYDQIKRLGTILPRDELRRFLVNIRYAEWHALYILLLAQSEDPQDHAFIEENVQSAERFRLNRQLAAWATAYIEVRGESALELFEQHYFENRNRQPEEIEALLLALSVHGTNGHTHLRERIVAEYRLVLEHYPAMVTRIVGDLLAWERFDLAEPVAALIESAPPSTDPVAVSQMRYYVNQARLARPTGADADPPPFRFGWVIALAALLLLAAGMAIASRPGKRTARR